MDDISRICLIIGCAFLALGAVRIVIAVRKTNEAIKKADKRKESENNIENGEKD